MNDWDKWQLRTHCTKVTMNYVKIMQSLQTKGNVQDLKRSNQRDNEYGKANFKALTDVTIWPLLRKISRDILARSPVASGDTSKRRTSSKSTSIQIEKPRRGHNLGCPETLFQARNSRVNDWVRNKCTKWHKQARHTLTGSSITLSLPGWSVKVNDGWNCRNINKYLQHIL